MLKPHTRDDSTATGDSAPETASPERRVGLARLTRSKTLLTTALSTQSRWVRIAKISVAVIVVITGLAVFDAMRPASTGQSSANPVVNDFKPTFGGVGAVIRIRGTSLSDATAVLFGGVASDDVTVISDRTIDVVVPSGAKTGRIGVRHGDTYESVALFTVKPTPVLAEVKPGSGGVKTTVTLTGEHFDVVKSITFNTQTARTFEVRSPTEIVVTVPAGAQTGRISVTTDGGTAVSASAFNIVETPKISQVSPGEAGVGGVVIIKGEHLSAASGVSFGGAPAKSFTVKSATEIEAIVPDGAETGSLSVSTAGGTATRPRFKIAEVPVILELRLPYGGVGSVVAITGSNLLRATSVTFNGVPALIVSNTTSHQIRVVVPVGATTGFVTVVTPGGTGVSAKRFAVLSFQS